ncbi:hypothetical protein JA1_001823 [Spathaspora sp. JA1]|nr:hypothetical protein JA1_001823 [Spathaspora sp. JA1]
MEKFSSWRDKATGISPFMPSQFPLVQEKSSFKRITTYIVKTPIFLIKFPFLLIISLLYTITNYIGFVKFIFQLLFGFNTPTFQVDGIKPSQVEKLQPFKPNQGDLIVSNYISPLDGFIISILANSSKVVFLIPNKQGILYQYSAWGVFNHCFNNVSSEQPVQDLTKFKNKCVVLLLEGTPSNNKSLLPFIQLDSKYTWEEINIKSLVLKMSVNYYTLSIPYIGKFQYLFQLLINLTKCSIKCKIYKFDTFDVKLLRRSFELNSLSLVNQELNLDAKEKLKDKQIPVIGRMCGLTNLRILDCNEHKLHKLIPIGLNKLPIKTLMITFKGYICRITPLHQIFNLGQLTTLELLFLSQYVFLLSLDTGLQSIFLKLTNVKHISVVCGSIRFDQLIRSLKPDSLHSLYLRTIPGGIVEQFQLENILEHLKGSLKRLYLGKDKIRKGRLYGLQEFDRIYKVKHLEDDSEELQDGLNKIRSMVNDSKSPNLNQVVLDGNCYFIKRPTKEHRVDPIKAEMWFMIVLVGIIEVVLFMGLMQCWEEIEKINVSLKAKKTDELAVIEQIRKINENLEAKTTDELAVIEQIRKINESLQANDTDILTVIEQIKRIKYEIRAIREFHLEEENNRTTIMALPDEVLISILNRLNQIHICRICTVNRRLYRLGKAKLYHSIYINISDDSPIQISPIIYTPFYLKYTIVNKDKPLEWLHKSSNINLIKNMVFREEHTCLENIKLLYPWINVSIDYESGPAQPSFGIKYYRYRRSFLSHGQAIQPSPWITKLTVHLNKLKDKQIAAIGKMRGLTNLRILYCNMDKLGKLDPIGLNKLPIKTLLMTYQDEISLIPLHLIFNLGQLTTFEVHFLSQDRLLSFDTGLQFIFWKLTNVKHISVVCGGIRFDQLIRSLNPDSLHSLYLRTVPGRIVEEFQLENILEHLKGSLKRLYIGNDQMRKGIVYGLQEFDRIYKVKHLEDDSEELQDDLNKIRNMVKDSKSPNLNQVVLDGNCYFIKRPTKENVYIVPCNTLISTNDNRSLEYSLSM